VPYEMPAIINAVGGIDLHGREGVTLQFRFGTSDLSVLTLWFEVDRILRKELTAGADAFEKIITLTQDDVTAIWTAGKSARFAVRAYNLTPPQVLWEGRVTIRAYNREPPL